MELLGTYTNNLDAKKRVIFPAKFREVLGDVFVITANVDRCLSAYTLEEWKKYKAKLDELPQTEMLAVRRFIFGMAINGVPDTQGRVLLKDNLIEYAGIKNSVTFIGCGDKVEIWDADSAPVTSTYSKEEIDDIRAIMLQYGL